MSKSNHIYYGSKIPYEELTNFIEPIEINIPITFSSLNNLVGPDIDSLYKIRTYIASKFSDLYSNFPTFKDQFKNMAENEIRSLRTISYTPHLTGYDFRMHPVDITNSIFYSLGYNNRIPFINLDDKVGKKYLKDYAYSNFNIILKKETDPIKKTIINELKDNYSKICDLYDEPLDIRKYIIPKDTLFFLAYRSLDLFEMTDDYRYLVFAKEYYDNVSHMKTSEYPHMIYRSKTNSRVWHTNYRKEFEDYDLNNIDIPINRYLLRESNVLIGYEILAPGEAEKVITDTVKRSRASSNVDYEKYEDLFEKKMNFYLDSPYVRTIMGTYGLNGYMGFLYKNEYLLFDKFYNTDTEDITRRTILTHGEAVYAFPTDRLDLITTSTKQEIIKEKKRDLRIRKFNHNDTFIPRVQKVIDGPNLSTSTFEEEIEKINKKVLILNREI